MRPRLTSLGSVGSGCDPQRPVSLVILTVIDQAVRDPHSDWTMRTRPIADLLVASQIPMVFVSDRPADDLMALQDSLGAPHPFIAEGGAELCVPQGYFSGLLGTVPTGRPWERLRLRARGGSGGAVRLLMSLYRLRDNPIMFVGLGEAWKDRALLRAVDVPVIVRNDGIDQERLVRALPAAYVTTAAGAAGWSEAILGSLSV